MGIPITQNNSIFVFLYHIFCINCLNGAYGVDLDHLGIIVETSLVVGLLMYGDPVSERLR